MSFISLQYIIFFLIMVAGFFTFPKNMRSLWLLLGSCYFYMAFVPKYILILFALILADFFLAKKIELTSGAKRHVYFLISVSANIGTLFVFKYFNFFNEVVGDLARLIHWNYSISYLTIMLPLGLSFHIFQSLSYVIEVYRGKYSAERNLVSYALYVLFFPQLIAGPIERPAHLLPQFNFDVSFDSSRILSGLRLMLWGFFKKMVIADRLAYSVDYVYAHASSAPSVTLFLAMIFFSIQLYADFSGYSDIARGSARVFGIDLMRNFTMPYFSKSISEFWRRWHISLSSWFRDYVYFPLSYSVERVSRFWLYCCVFITFLLTGIWHGAGWNFVMLGVIHGGYIVFSLLTKTFRDWVRGAIFADWGKSLCAIYQTLLTFLLVSFSWVFFRSPNIDVSWEFMVGLMTRWDRVALGDLYVNSLKLFGVRPHEFILSIMVVFVLLAVEYGVLEKSFLGKLQRRSLLLQSTAYSLLMISIVVFGVISTKQFIYFQF